MGASADQIDRQIRETRERMDENLGVLEARAASNAVRYARIVAIVVGAAAAGGAAFLLYRRFRSRPALKDRLREMPPQAIRELGSRLKNARRSMPSVTLTLNDDGHTEPGALESIVRKLAPALIGTAATAVIERTTGRRASDDLDERDTSQVAPAFD